MLGSAAAAEELEGECGASLTFEARPVTSWIADLGVADPTVIRRALRALAKLERDARSALPALIKLCTSEDVQVRADAAYAMAKVGAVDEEGLAALRALILDKEDVVSENVIAFVEPDSETVSRALAPAIERALTTAGGLRALELVHLVGRMPAAEARLFAPRLEALVQDRSDDVSAAALLVLAVHCTPSAALISRARRLASSPDRRAAGAAVVLLAAQAPTDSTALGDLESVLAKADALSLWLYVGALRDISALTAGVGPRLLRIARRSPDPRVRDRAIRFFAGRRDHVARDCLEELGTFLQDESETVREAAALVLLENVRFLSTAALEQAAGAAKHAEHASGIMCLGIVAFRRGSFAREERAALLESAKSADWNQRRSACRVFECTGLGAEFGCDVLRTLRCGDAEPAVRFGAARARAVLGCGGPK